MNEQDKIMQYCFFAGVLVLFIFAYIFFSTSSVDERGVSDIKVRIEDSQDLNRKLQDGAEQNKKRAAAAIERLGSAEAELGRAASAIDRCEQILETAERRTQEKSPQAK